MKSRQGWTQWLFIFAIAFLSLFLGEPDNEADRQILERADRADEQLDLNVLQSHEQNGTVFSSDRAWRFTTGQLQRNIARIPEESQHRFYTWSGNGHREITGSASGINQHSYFANSFLVGFKPFDTNSIWEPLATLALRKSYVLDHKLYGPRFSEIWQNSRQAYGYSRGDCEDHAIILADWLIAMGHQARVVLGNYNGGGHAWVVLIKEGKEYILESTSKRRPRSINDFKLARLATQYRPKYQFDRINFWVNTGSTHTTKYSDGKWQLRSKYAASH